MWIQNHPIIIYWKDISVSSVQFSRSVLSDSFYPMDCMMPGFPVHHQHLKFTQTHDHRVSDGIQPSHPLSSPYSPALHLSQHQGLFQWVSFSHQVAKVLKSQLQHQSFQWILRLISSRIDWLDLLAVQETLKRLLQIRREIWIIWRFSEEYSFWGLNP